MPGDRFRGMTRKQQKAERARLHTFTPFYVWWWEQALAGQTWQDMRERRWRREWLELWALLAVTSRFD